MCKSGANSAFTSQRARDVAEKVAAESALIKFALNSLARIAIKELAMQKMDGNNSQKTHSSGYIIKRWL
jgi:hypothetical protein